MTITNKYPGKCSVCSCAVAVAAGAAIRGGDGKWTVRCCTHAGGAPVAAARNTTTVYKAPSMSGRTRRPGKWTGCSCGSREDSSGSLIPSRRNCSSCEHDA